MITPQPSMVTGPAPMVLPWEAMVALDVIRTEGSKTDVDCTRISPPC